MVIGGKKKGREKFAWGDHPSGFGFGLTTGGRRDGGGAVWRTWLRVSVDGGCRV